MQRRYINVIVIIACCFCIIIFRLWSIQIQNGQIEIFTISGQLVYSQKMENQKDMKLEMNVDDGVYILQVNSDLGVQTQRLIIKTQ